MRHQRIVNLNFHGIGSPSRGLEPGENSYWISEDAFLEIVDLVRERADVRLTFDDGNASDIEIVLPALRSRKLRGTFFPIAERIGRPGSVDRDGLRRLVTDGMVVGSHGMRHLAWRHLTDDQLDDELVAARDVIAEHAGAPVVSAACPLGSYDHRVLARLRKLGYARVFTSDRAPARPSAWLQPRFSIRSFDDAASVRRVLDGTADRRARLLADARVALKRWR